MSIIKILFKKAAVTIKQGPGNMFCSNAKITVLIHYLSFCTAVGGTSTAGTRDTPRNTRTVGCTASEPCSLITTWFPEENPEGQGNPRPPGRSPDTTAGPGSPFPAPCRARRYRGNGAAEPRGPVTRQRRPGPARALPGRRPVATATITLPSLAASPNANALK